MALLAALPAEARPALLDSSDGSGVGWLGWSPDQEISGKIRPSSTDAGTENRPWPLADHDPALAVEEAMAGESWNTADVGPGPVGGWVGWFGFECGHAWERWPWSAPYSESFPDYAFARYRRSVQWKADGSAQLLWAELPRGNPSEAQEVIREWEAWMKKADGLSSMDEVAPLALTPIKSSEDYQNSVRVLRQWIGDGELFQANLSHVLSAQAPPDPRHFFAKLREHQPTAMSAFMEWGGEQTLLSWTPERFLSIQGEQLKTFPIKGTAPRGKNQREDHLSREGLEKSEKECAELNMIVDMARHDLGRLAPPGGVHVVSEGAVETFPTLYHRTAQISSQWNPRQGLSSLMKATFPPASVTGAPKVRALQAIQELEGTARGPYCGCFGYWIPGEPRGDFSVLIRSAVIQGKELEVSVGAGIVWDSDPLKEWQETLLKARYLSSALDETTA